MEIILFVALFIIVIGYWLIRRSLNKISKAIEAHSENYDYLI
jgi:flagellar biogenesis protein FliO